MLEAKHSSDIDVVEEVVPGGVAASFLITFEDGTKIFHAGDTGLFKDMKDIIGDIYKPDIVMVPIGDKFTMGPFEAALASMWLNPKVVIPMHYNTFPPIRGVLLGGEPHDGRGPLPARLPKLRPALCILDGSTCPK